MKYFPPQLEVGTFVWTEVGYREHGPLEGPKQDIPGPQAGKIVSIEKAFMTIDQRLYAVKWASGHTSKHYGAKLFAIGRFQSRKEFEEATEVLSVELMVGPKGGFRSAAYRVKHDGEVISGTTFSREDWRLLERLANRDGLEITRSQA